MKFDEHAEYRSRLSTRLITDNDIHHVNKIISSNESMFGTNIAQYHSLFTQSFSSSAEGIKVGVEEDNILIGVIKVFLWDRMPFWHVGANFVISRPGLNYTRNRIAALVMYEKCMEIAASNRHYDGYIALPDIGAQFKKRKELHLQMSPYINSRYIVNDVDVILPFGKSKWDLFNMFMGPMLGKNVRPIVIRHSTLKSEYRNET